MNGLNMLNDLPENVKTEIGNKYGSMFDFYLILINLNHEQRLAYRAHDKNIISQIDNKLLDIEDFLENIGVEDGSDITLAASNDYGDIVVKDTIEELNRILAPLGTDFETMRKELEDRYWK